MSDQLSVGIILSSTRPGRVSPQVGDWVKGIADKRGDARYEIVDLLDFNLPMLGAPNAEEPVKRCRIQPQYDRCIEKRL